VNIKDSFCNKHCRISLHDVGGKLVQTLDSGVGWGWGRGNLHGNGDGDGKFFVGTVKVKVKERIAVSGIPSHSYGTSLAMWDHTVLPATRHK